MLTLCRVIRLQTRKNDKILSAGADGLNYTDFLNSERDDLRIGLIDKESQNLESKLVLDGLSNITTCRLSFDCRRAVVGSSGGQLTIYDLQKSKNVLSLSGSVSSMKVGKRLSKIQFSAENELFYSGGVFIWKSCLMNV